MLLGVCDGVFLLTLCDGDREGVAEPVGCRLALAVVVRVFD